MADIKGLCDALSQTKDIKAWRFELNDALSLEVGINQNALCGPYAPPNLNKSLTGLIVIKWKDGRTTQAAVEAHHLENIGASIKDWKAQAYKDPKAAQILPPQIYPHVQVYDPAVEEILKKPEYLFKMLDILSKGLKGASSIDAGLTCAAMTSYLRSSTGMDETLASTQLVASVYADGQYGESEHSRRILTEEKMARLAQRVKEVFQFSKKKGKIKEQKMDVILAPEVAQEFLDHYVENNLMGSSVAENQSAFKRTDFGTKKQRFSSKVNVVLDSITDFEMDSFPFDKEGIAAGTYNLIEKGVLRTPILDTRYANLLHMKPTGKTGKVYLDGTSTTAKKLLASTTSGIIVYGVLGMHTQSSVRGDYSLPAYLAFEVRKGKIVGAVKATISGNFFKDLSSSSTIFARDEEDPFKVAILVHCNVSPMK